MYFFSTELLTHHSQGCRAECWPHVLLLAGHLRTLQVGRAQIRVDMGLHTRLAQGPDPRNCIVKDDLRPRHPRRTESEPR